MADIKISDVIGNLDQYKYNPAMMQRMSLEVLRQVTDDTINIVDPTNPFVYSLENTAVNTAVFMQHAESLTRRLYPSVAQNTEDLYLHMSDKDYIDRFAVPSSAKFNILLDKNELLNKLVLDPETGIRKITLPRNTVFTVAGVSFSLQYPIDIRLLSHGGLQIVYINDQPSPLQDLSTNIVDWQQVTDPNGTAYVQFTVEAMQFYIETRYNDVSAASGFKTDIPLTDSFYYVRCYIQNDLGQWVEILTTHTQQIYDPNTPTAVIKVLDNNVRVVIPVIYTSTGLVKGKLRIDVYQTKGYLSMMLNNYKLDDFTANWYSIDSKDKTEFTAAITNFKTVAIWSTTYVNSGRDQLSFGELKDRVIRNAVGKQNLPITNVQLETSLEDANYEIVKNVDTITNRIFLATRNLPGPVDEKILTPAAATMSTITTTLKEAADAYGAIDNGNSVTLLSKVIYQNKNGITKPISNLEYNRITSLPILQKCKDITDGKYFYSPFTYVLNAAKETFEVRPYYLDDPSIETKNFIAENATTGLQVSIAASYSLVKTDTGFQLNFVTDSSDAFKALPDEQIYVQLAFKSKNQNERLYTLGTLIGKDEQTKERLYRFDLTSNFNIDNDDYIELTSFESDANGLSIKASLLQSVDIFFITTSPMDVTWTPNSIDTLIGKFQLPDNAVAITHENLKLRFGYSLKNMWAMSRSVVSSVPYQVYLTDVLAFYKKDVYEIDPQTGSYFSVNEQGELVYNLLHQKGEPILDANGHQVIEHYKGEIVYDETGDPVPMAGYEREMVRLVDILMIEGVYYFANDAATTTYRNVLVKSLLTWITEDMTYIQKRLLDQTRIFFYPKVTAGDIKVITSANERITVPAGQSIKIKLYVPATTYNDDTLRSALNKTTIQTLAAALKSSTVSISAIQETLRGVYKTDVIDVEVSGLGGENPQNVFTVLDTSNRCSIRKRLTALQDNQLIVEEDVSITYVLHGENS